MHTSFWSHCQNLVHRLQVTRAGTGRRVRRLPPRRIEGLEARTLLSSTPAMVADINPGAAASNPANLAAIGPTTYFTADDGMHGVELWKSDGTPGGTTLVKDINQGSGSSSPGNLTNVNGTLFFTAWDGTTSGTTLWKSDGTTGGTMMVADVGASDLTNVNGTLFFESGITGGFAIWKSDGTAAGTSSVKDFYFGANGPEVSGLASFDGALFFGATDGTPYGTALWKSDGSAAGTTIVQDFSSTTGEAAPNDLTVSNGMLFFAATDGTANGTALWKSDGTPAGTQMVEDFGANTNGPGSLTDVNGTLFFVDGGNLWKSDGTTAGTVTVGSTSAFTAPSPYELTDVNGTLFFLSSGQGWGTELWKSDGTAAGTVLLNDPSTSTLRGVNDMTNVDGMLYFSGYDSVNGTELWQSDGTVAGTKLVQDIYPGSVSGVDYYGYYYTTPNSSYPGNLTNANGTLFFTSNDGVHGTELWSLPPSSSTPAPSLDVSGFPSTITAGTAGGFTVTAKNGDGTTNTGYTGTIQFSSSDPQATIVDPSTGSPVALQGFTYTFTTADAGVHTFSATLETAGAQSLMATDAANPERTATEGNILVNPAAASTMTVAGFPSPDTAGVAGNFMVTLRDTYGNIATGYLGTVHFTSSDAKAVLPANYTFTAADAGTHSFSATLRTSGTQSITAADTVAASLLGTEGGITVNPAAASKFLITAPSSVHAGVPFSLTLMVEDAYGNVVTGYTGTVHFTSTDRRATLPANYTFTAADKGVHTFSGLVLRKKGKQTITITDTHNAALTGSVIENVL